jgi:hypothetical protein
MQPSPDQGIPATGAAAQPDEGFSVQTLAVHQVQHVVVATGNLISTLIFLLSSALALVAALAWNKAISDWLPTVNLFNLTNPVAKDFLYALVATLFAVVLIGILGVINNRIKGKNLLVQSPPK